MVRRVRWKALAALVAVVGAVMVCLMIRISMAHERTEFVGNVDPKSGDRCRFTISSDWKHSEAERRLKVSPGKEFDVFHLTRNPTRQWIEDHLLHRQATNAPTISVMVMDMVQNKFTGPFHIVEGYPELAGSGREQVVTHLHQNVNGYHATVFNVRGALPSDPFRQSVLMLHVPDRSLLCVVFGSGDISNIAQTDREMQAIIASFHVEKVPKGGKR